MNYQIINYKKKTPEIKKNVFIASGVKIIGDVFVDTGTSIWFNSVIRGDVNFVRIGKNTNIQDGTIIHVSSYGFSANGKNGFPTIIGNNVTIGHNATIHACKINDFALIGMGSVILDNSVVEKYSLVAAGAVLTPGTKVKKKELWAGNPAKFIRKINEREKKLLENTPNVYSKLSKEFLKK
jgi:carbonic anhydrase/acetyltransferase-like protein (isoleucine patch superfamily)